MLTQATGSGESAKKNEYQPPRRKDSDYRKDIPGVGLLFKNTSITKAKTELVVMITPSAVANEEDARKVTCSDS